MRFIHWRRIESEVIRDIETSRVGYYISVGDRSVSLVVAAHKDRKYLKTELDGYSLDNLVYAYFRGVIIGQECTRQEKAQRTDVIASSLGLRRGVWNLVAGD